MFEVRIYVHHKDSILDPQGEAVLNALHRLNYSQVTAITQGKYFETNINAASKEEAVTIVESICKDLLVNHNMESFEYELKEVAK